jgi:hypothetical protein
MSDPTTSQQIMIDDGLPPAAIIPAAERSASWSNRPARPAQTTESIMKTNAETTSKADQVKGLRERRAEAKGRVESALGRALTKPTKASTSERRVAKKAQKAETASIRKTAKAKVRAEKPTSGHAKTIQPGSKLAVIDGLLRRKGGCTSKEICDATGWKAVSVPPTARRLGIKLKQEKREGATYYSAAD